MQRANEKNERWSFKSRWFKKNIDYGVKNTK